MEGFSAYRAPGPLVHFPVLFSLLYVGYHLCWAHPATQFLIVTYGVTGLYLGRDWAVSAHYNALYFLLGIGLAVVCYFATPWIRSAGASVASGNWALAAIVTALMIAGFIFHVRSQLEES